ncbi:MAG: MBL fold hydrolase [Ignavibacteriae bacterium]|nr:MBL fold hydrolase [Ignavibacteriota bacterium]
MLKIKRFVFSSFMENSYVVFDDQSKEAACIDPGCLTTFEENELKNFIEENSLQLKYLINTHCHLDHIFGNAFVTDYFDVKFYAPEKDMFLLEEMPNIAAKYGCSVKSSPKPDVYITEDIELKIGEIKIKFLFTPGHTPGEYCLVFHSQKVLFSGDVLFLESIGRTDLPGGDFNTLINSIHTKLFTLDDDFVVFPGHGDSTSIGYEKKNNPFLS